MEELPFEITKHKNMKNPLKKNVPNNHAWYLIVIALLLAIIYFWAFGLWHDTELSVVKPAQAQEEVEEVTEVKAPISGAKGYPMVTGAFSDVECGSKWCNRHEPKDNQVALNLRKWPGATEVYIPAFGKTYRVVGNTYSETGNHLDLEVWFGQDQQAAKNYGIKELLVNVTKYAD